MEYVNQSSKYVMETVSSVSDQLSNWQQMETLLNNTASDMSRQFSDLSMLYYEDNDVSGKDDNDSVWKLPSLLFPSSSSSSNGNINRHNTTSLSSQQHDVRHLLSMVHKEHWEGGNGTSATPKKRNVGLHRFAKDLITSPTTTPFWLSSNNNNSKPMSDDHHHDGNTTTTTTTHNNNNNNIGLGESFVSVMDGDASRTAAPSSVVTRNSLRDMSHEEIASRLAEGTLRQLRDVALEEARELHESLRFWTSRWERPILSWMEAGPTVWFSEQGYDHQSIGKRVSQTQAVLARRCAAIGELQQHLLRAGWRKGVAQWGVLGQGGQWSAVAGGDGVMEEAPLSTRTLIKPRVAPGDDDEEEAAISSSPYVLNEAPQTPITKNSYEDLMVPLNDTVAENGHGIKPKKTKLKRSSSFAADASIPKVDVRNGGGIQTDDSALAAWAIDAIHLVRYQLYRAGNRTFRLPFDENWDDMHEQPSNSNSPIRATMPHFPKWAREEVLISSCSGLDREKEVVVCDLPLMASEVSALLGTIDTNMTVQRNRRLVKLKPPSVMRRNWYMAAIGFPMATYVLVKLLKDGYGWKLAMAVWDKLVSFYADHVSGPVKAIYKELFTRKGREDISDRKARMDAIENLKSMLYSWLDETYPEMSEMEKEQIADGMDMSLIENRKAESIKTIYEINSVVWMSLIEMQFIKKELMNALYAMDELIISNEINLNLAAVTPAVLLVYTFNKMFRFLFYALLKIKQSREETYAYFRLILLDIERLLVMRDNPPLPPPPLGVAVADTNEQQHEFTRPIVLSSYDLGMLMLHIQECRNILWSSRRRFSTQIRRSVSEDLSELAGERGAVSVQQQLQIISRMCRTYPFLKVVSTGVPFDMSRFGNTEV